MNDTTDTCVRIYVLQNSAGLPWCRIYIKTTVLGLVVSMSVETTKRFSSRVRCPAVRVSALNDTFVVVYWLLFLAGSVL